MAGQSYDAVLILSFGGPEQLDEVIPFLENVLRGRNIPRERMLEVAEHYYHFGGKSPINEQNRELIAGLGDELERNGPRLPIYWGNRRHAAEDASGRDSSRVGIRYFGFQLVLRMPAISGRHPEGARGSGHGRA